MRRRRSGLAVGAFLSALAVVSGCTATPSTSSGPTAQVSATDRTPIPTPIPTATPVPASPTPSPPPNLVKATAVVSGLADPVDVTSAGDNSGRMFVVEQAGRIRIVKDGQLVDRPFIDISDRIACCDEQGLLGLAFHPDYPTDPRFFVDYTDLKGDTVVASLRVGQSDGNVADPASETVILRVDQPFPNHNGGAVAFGPDGKLYISFGDGGDGGDPLRNGQRVDTLLAKILRIDIDVKATAKSPYTVPKDNPFVSDPKARPEIWLTGLRNPWRIRFDTTTGNLWIGDVGQEWYEEVDVAPRGIGGLNFGWNRMEGFHCFEPYAGCDQKGMTLQVAEYQHPKGCAIIGGVVVHDAAHKALDGRYLFGDACTDTLWTILATGDGQRTPEVVASTGRTLSSINTAEDGTIYATSLDQGELLTLSAAGN